MRRTWMYAAMTKREGNAADGRFSAACHRQSISGPNRMLMASVGQSSLQEPQCQHSSGYLTTGTLCSLSRWITSNGQWRSQIPHPLHFFRSITGGMTNLPLENRECWNTGRLEYWVQSQREFLYPSFHHSIIPSFHQNCCPLAHIES